MPTKDRPSKAVIENDAKLDAWVEKYAKKMSDASGSGTQQRDVFEFSSEDEEGN